MHIHDFKFPAAILNEDYAVNNFSWEEQAFR